MTKAPSTPRTHPRSVAERVLICPGAPNRRRTRRTYRARRGHRGHRGAQLMRRARAKRRLSLYEKFRKDKLRAYVRLRPRLIR
jgi:hypothetical protein